MNGHIFRGFAPTAQAGLSPLPLSRLGFVTAAPKPWADGLRPLYPPTTPRRQPHRVATGFRGLDYYCSSAAAKLRYFVGVSKS
jgi:hypothetical protein